MKHAKLKTTLINLGMKQAHKGFDYLVKCTLLCKANQYYFVNTMEMYKVVAEENNTTYGAVERCIRFCVKKSNYQKLGFKKAPSNTEFINAVLTFIENKKVDRNYRETLAYARTHNIDPTELSIAYEVESVFGETDDFESICQLVYEAYLKCDNYDINRLVRNTHTLMHTHNKPIQDIDRYEVAYYD